MAAVFPQAELRQSRVRRELLTAWVWVCETFIQTAALGASRALSLRIDSPEADPDYPRSTAFE